jgi:hypothetical protein
MDPFALDADTAERLMAGMVDAGDAPPEYRAVARTLHALRAAPESSEWAGEQTAVLRIEAAVVVHRPPTRRERRSRRSSSRVTRLVTAGVALGAMCLTGAFASAGALPQPAQHAASAVLGSVGISVPTGGEVPADGPQTGTSTPAGATGPSQPAATAPGANAAPAAPPRPTGSRTTDVRGDQGNNASPGKANGHKTRSSNGQDGGSVPQGSDNANGKNDNKP